MIIPTPEVKHFTHCESYSQHCSGRGRNSVLLLQLCLPFIFDFERVDLNTFSCERRSCVWTGGVIRSIFPTSYVPYFFYLGSSLSPWFSITDRLSLTSWLLRTWTNSLDNYVAKNAKFYLTSSIRCSIYENREQLWDKDVLKCCCCLWFPYG